MLISYINKVLESVLRTMLNVVATVCNQGSTKGSAINKLIKINQKSSIRCNNEENRTIGFTIKDVEIIPVYDVHHLTKSIRNNILDKDVVFTLNSKDHYESWDYIILIQTMKIMNLELYPN